MLDDIKIVEEFADRMSRIMDEKNLCRGDILQKTGLHHSILSNIFRKKRIPSKLIARDIAEALGEPMWMFDDLYEVDNLDGEVWAPIEGLDGYECSTKGRVKNANTGRIMKTQANERGYHHVQLHVNKKEYTKRVNRLIGETFLDGGGGGFDVNHKHGNKANNSIDELEWMTRSENVQHAYDTGLKKPSRQTPIYCFETDTTYESVSECSRILGVDKSSIFKQMAGKMPHIKGYHFERVDNCD